MWLPFLFQDMRQGRRSGILVPRFGINDVVRSNSGYRRQVTNLGYYFAINDYVDLQASVDWFAGTHTALNGEFRYRWLDRFVQGSLGIARIFEAGADGLPGGRSMRLQWNHQQSFNQRTRLTAAVDYATSARVIQQNAVDPLLQTATLGSRVNFSKQFDWGTLTIGGNRTQDLSNNYGQPDAPECQRFACADKHWRSTHLVTVVFAHSNPTPSSTARLRIPTRLGAAVRVRIRYFRVSAILSVRIATPIRIGRWNWQNDVSIQDFTKTLVPGPGAVDDHRPDGFHGRVNPVLRRRLWHQSVDWNTGINLPSLFPATWKLAAVGFDSKHHRRRFHDSQPKHKRSVRSAGQATFLRGEYVSRGVRVLSRHRARCRESDTRCHRV